jgi:putative ABC transport system permease protein
MHNAISTWRWHILRRLLPRWYADRYSSELLQTHLDGATPGFWWRLTTDVVLTSIQLRIAGEREPMRALIGQAARGLARTPGFTMTVVLTLGLGIGATLTLFMVLDRLLLSPPAHVVNAHDVRRVLVHGVNPFSKTLGYTAALSYPDYRDLGGVHGFEQIAAFGMRKLTLGTGANSQSIQVELTSASYFPLLGVRPALGRFYQEEDDRIGSAEPTAVLGHAFWRSRFGGDSAVIGHRLRLGKGTYTVTGVAPRDFTGVNLTQIDVWLPMLPAQEIETGSHDWADATRWYWLSALVRLPDGSDGVAATAEATARYVNGRRAVQGQDLNARIHLSPIMAAQGPIPSHEVSVARALGALALVVLLIACANVANLLLARGVQRRRYLAIQQAIGLSRGGLVKQLMVESLLLASAAGVIAVVFTVRITPLLFRTLIPDAAMAMTGGLRLAIVTSTLAIGVTILIGLMPSLRSSQFDVLEALRSRRETRRGVALRRGLVFVQAALCALLLVGAAMFVNSLQRASRLDMGVDTDALAVDFELENGTRWGTEVNDVAYAALQRLRQSPLVQSAAVTSLPQFQGNLGITIETEGGVVENTGRGPFFYTASGQYFETVGLRIMRGRGLTDEDDRTKAAVAVLSQSLARAAFGSEDVLGRCIYVESKQKLCTRVVGVVEDALPTIKATEPNLNLYFPIHHPADEGAQGGSVIIRTRGTAPKMEEIRGIARSAAPGIRLVSVSPLSGFLEHELRPWRLGAVLLTAFGILAMLVAAAGVYSLLSFDVVQRRYELGVRAAVGANATQLVRDATARSLIVMAGGTVTGLVLSAFAADAAADLLFGVSPTEVSVYAVVAVVLALVAICAAALPAWRAARLEPRIALQAE